MLYTMTAVLFVAVYYLCNLRTAGLAGRGSGAVWRRRAFPRGDGAGAMGALWMHVAGPGDARAGLLWLTKLRERAPELRVLVTCGTAAAREVMGQALDGRAAALTWLPFDCPYSVRRFLRVYRPAAFVGMQGEFWPVLVRELRRRGIPSLMLRVDMFDWDTQEEFPRVFGGLYRRMLSHVDLFSVRRPGHRDNLLKLGVAPERIRIGLDYRPECLPPVDDSRCARYRALLGLEPGEALVTLAGPRLDELEALLPLLLPVPGTRLLLATVGPDDAVNAERMLRKRNVRSARRSLLEAGGTPARVVLLDTQGELFHFYALSDVVVVGDSFPPAFAEGRNYWEPLRQGAPVVHGPALPEVAAMELLRVCGAMCRAEAYADVPRLVQALIGRPGNRGAIRQGVDALLGTVESASGRDVRLVMECLERRQGQQGKAGAPAGVGRGGYR